MSIAFGHFDEPLAWLVRGLIEYGWVDITRHKVLPAQAVGGFDLSFIPDSQGRSGLMLRVPAVAGGQRCHEDESYSFEIKLIQVGGGSGFAVRCEACNYLQEFPFSAENPIWAAGYIHQGLSDYITEFVRWRLGGGALTWAQRQGVPDIDGAPCSASLASWIGQQLTLQRNFDSTLWGQGVRATPQPTSSNTPLVTTGNYGQTKGGGAPADELLRGPSKALFVMISLGGTAAAMAFFNILVTVALFGVSRPLALVTNFLLVVFAGGGGIAAWLGLREYRQMKGSILPWIAIVYPALIPICCFGGIPISVWAARRWQSDAVVRRRRSTQART